MFARYAADHLFSEIRDVGVRDGANLVVDGYSFAPTFSIWTTIEECLNPPVIWEHDRGWFTTPPFSEPEVFDFPAGIGAVECVNVEHEEVLLIPRWVDCKRVTFKYGLGDEFIEVLRTLHLLGLDSTTPVTVRGVDVSPRDVVAATLPDPATLGDKMHGLTCAGTWVTGTGKDGAPREVYLYHVSDNDECMAKHGCQAVVWQTAMNPVVALELLEAETWSGAGVLGPEAFDAVPFLDLLARPRRAVGNRRAQPVVSELPSSAVVLLLDSLNRHLIGPYGGTEFETPNLDRLASRSVRFDRHYSGSLPCMPARHDILCGALDFLWKPWGSVELWEESLTVPLREAGVTTKLVTDHPHLFETGGENYHVDFGAWDYQRGHESDPWRTRPDPSWMGAPSFGRGHMPYDDSRGWFHDESDFPGPRTMAAAARWLTEEAPAHDRFLLFVDEFDPHEPFDTPEPYASMYDTEWEGPHLVWPPYRVGAQAEGLIDDREARQIRRQLRRQAHHDRRLARPGARRARRAGPLGRHRGDPLHRPRPLPRREGHLGQARRPDLRTARSHAVADRVAGGRTGITLGPHHGRRPARDAPRRVRHIEWAPDPRSITGPRDRG